MYIFARENENSAGRGESGRGGGTAFDLLHCVGKLVMRKGVKQKISKTGTLCNATATAVVKNILVKDF